MKSLFQKSLLFNVLLMVLVVAALVLVLLTSLHSITKHGQDAKVPNVVGKKLAAGMSQLSGFEVKIDSIYLPYKDPLEIVYQDPQPDNIVKVGRIIFLTVNKTTPPMIAMPPLVNMSFRNAVLTLQGFRLIMGDTIFKPDIAAGAVLDQLYNGKSIAAGAQVPVGSRIDLIVGAGLSDSIMPVPDLIGRTFAEARSLLDASGILYNIVWEGSISDSNAAVIYNQQPESKDELDFESKITPGDMIDLRIMQRPSAELLRMNQAGSRKFLDPNDTNAVVTYGPNTTEMPVPVDANGATTTSTTAKPKPKKPAATTAEEVEKLLNAPKEEKPEKKPTDEGLIGPKQPSADKPNIADKNAKTGKPENKNSKTPLGKDGKPLKPTDKDVKKKPKPKDKVKEKDKNDFKDDY
jgi:eukaryotic-like serine/threonine-protein kinase